MRPHEDSMAGWEKSQQETAKQQGQTFQAFGSVLGSIQTQSVCKHGTTLHLPFLVFLALKNAKPVSPLCWNANASTHPHRKQRCGQQQTTSVGGFDLLHLRRGTPGLRTLNAGSLFFFPSPQVTPLNSVSIHLNLTLFPRRKHRNHHCKIIDCRTIHTRCR